MWHGLAGRFHSTAPRFSPGTGTRVSRESLAERLRLAALLGKVEARALLSGFSGSTLALSYVPVPVPERLLIAPQDLRTADAELASEIYSGRFSFAGKAVSLNGSSVFELEPPSAEWAQTLHGFGWLRHLRAAGTTIARANARALVGDWMRGTGTARDLASQPDVMARRIISWLTQATFILQDAELDFYRRFVRSLTRQVRQLRRGLNRVEDGYPRLQALIALVFAGLCMSDQPRLLRAAQRRLEEELDRQILPDGGPLSRNPGMLIDLLLDLLPLLQSYTARNIPAPAALMNAMDRMMPMLRFFRHGDGAFAHFHGMGLTSGDQLATILSFDDARGAPVSNATYSGYQRLEAAGSVLIADTGAPPPFTVSRDAHASCLSFEFSSGRNQMIVNCGMAAVNRDVWRQVARASAAHSTLVVADTSSCRFLHGPRLNAWFDAPVIEGPQQVEAQRGVRNEAILLRASHDGYAQAFGIIHRRSWRLSQDGGRLDGEDMLIAIEGNTRPDPDAPSTPYAIRFHLHPTVSVERFDDPHTVLLCLPNGEAWAFAAPGMPVMIEESIYLASPTGPRRTSQLVLAGEVPETRRVVWTFMRTREAQGSRAR